MYQENDKENYYISPSPSPQCKYDVRKGESKTLGYNYEKPETKRGFSRLLKDATNIIRSDLDHQVAEKFQDDDATAVINGWILEQRDSRLAHRVAKEMEAEFNGLRHSEISQGEATAMTIALEERMKLLQHRQRRMENEDKDHAMAKNEYDDEVGIMSLCLSDDAYAKGVQDEEDKEYADSVRVSEERAKVIRERNTAIDLAADEKVAQEHQLEVDRECRGLTVKQEERDCKLARNIAHEEYNNSQMHNVTKEKQENGDKMTSKKLQVTSIRAEHRRKKYVEMVNKSADISIEDLWEFADPTVDDVPYGICVSLLLPNIITINVKLTGKCRITVNAKRLIRDNEKSTATVLNSGIDIDFDIEGIEFALTNDDLSYEYESEENILHVYIEKVHLENSHDLMYEKTKSNNDIPKPLNTSTLQSLKNKISRTIFGY